MGHKKNKQAQSETEELDPSDDNVEVSNSEENPEADVMQKSKKLKKKTPEPPEAQPESLNDKEVPVENEQKEVKKEKRKRGRKPKNYIPEDRREAQGLNEAAATGEEETSSGDQKNKTDKIKGKKNNNNVEEEKVIDWPEKDLSELFKRMEAAIPERDTFAFSTRTEKLNWDDIAFKGYSSEECKSIWLLVQKRLRRFRLLSELLSDAKEWITKPWTNFYGGQKTKRHPDMPRRPLSTYMLFYLQKKDKIIAENPGLEMTEISKIITQMYKALSPAKREKYMKEAAEKRKIYEQELEEFHRQHPEIPRNIEKQSQHKLIALTAPKKPNSPFVLYYENQLKSLNPSVYVDKHTFKEQCKEQWKNMSDKKKVIWINWALDEETKYQDELKNYMIQNPDFIPVPVKAVLTKEEKLIRERMAGKPVKPPNSSYSLFSRMMLQSEEIKDVNPKDRMVVIAERWKSCTEEERKQYSERILHLREQYKLDFASYLESLSEEKRQEELRNNMPKRKRSISKNEEPVVIKKKKSDSETSDKSKKSIKEESEEGRSSRNIRDDGDSKKYNDDDSKKTSPFAKPQYWHRMKKEEKQTFKNAMMKLKEHLDSRFEKYISSRATDSSDDSDDSDDSESSSSS